MAISFVQTNSNTSNSASSIAAAFSGIQTAANFNVVVVNWGNNTSTISSITDTQGNTYTIAQGPDSVTGSPNISQVIYFAKNIKAGSNTVTVVFNTTTAFPCIEILEYSGVDTLSPLDGRITTNGTGTTATTGTLVTTATNDLLLAAANTTANFTAAGPGYTSRIISAFGTIVEDSLTNVAGNNSATATGNSGTWLMQYVAFKAAFSPINGGFVDNFNTGTLSPTWTIDTGNAPGNIPGVNAGTFSASNISMANSVLGLKVTQTGSGPVNSVGAEVRSVNTFGYGIYVWTMRSSSTAVTPTGAGSVTSGQISSGFTFINNSQTEIDCPEIEGQHPQAIEFTNWTSSSTNQASTTNVTFNPEQGFHEYKCIWFPGSPLAFPSGVVYFYIDGVLVSTHTTNVPNAPAFILMNHWGTNSTGFGGLATIGVTRWLYFSRFQFSPLPAHFLTISWNAPVGGTQVTSYNIKRAAVSTGPYSLIGTSTVTNFQDNGPFVEGNTYWYEITSVGPGGESAPTATMSGVIPVTIFGFSKGVATVSGTLTNRSGNLGGVSAGRATVHGTMKGAGVLGSNVLVGHATLFANAKLSARMVGSPTGVATVHGLLRGAGRMVASSTGAAVISGTLSNRSSNLKAVCAGVASVTGTVKGTGKLVALSTGRGFIVATGRATGRMASVVTGLASVTAVLTPKVNLVSTITGQATSSATIKGAGKLVSSPKGSSLISAPLKGNGALAGSSTGKGTISATLTSSVTGQLKANLIASSSVVSLLKAAGKLQSTVTGQSAITALISGRNSIKSLVSGSASVSGTLRGSGRLIAAPLGKATLSSTLTSGNTSGQLKANVRAVCSLSPNLKASGKLIASSTGHSVISLAPGALNANLASAIVGHSSITSTLKGAGRLNSVVLGQSKIVPTINATGILISSITGRAFTNFVNIGSIGRLISSITGTSSASLVKNGIITSPAMVTGHATVSGTAKGAGQLNSSAAAGRSFCVAMAAASGQINAVTGGTSSVGLKTGGIVSAAVNIVGTSIVKASTNGVITANILGHSSVSANLSASGPVLAAFIHGQAFVIANTNAGPPVYFQAGATTVNSPYLTPGMWTAAVIILTNIGAGTMTYSVTTDQTWLTPSTASGTLLPGQQTAIEINVNMISSVVPLPEPTTAHVTVNSNAPGFPIEQDVQVAPILRINATGSEIGGWHNPIRFGSTSRLEW